MIKNLCVFAEIQSSMAKVLSHVMQISGGQTCDHLTVMASRNISGSGEMNHLLQRQKPNLLVTAGHLAKSRVAYTSFLTSSITCLTSTVWTSNPDIKELAKVAKGLQFHTAFAVGDRVPKAKTLKASSGPVIWIERDKSHVRIGNLQ